jgi:riboflavin transporter FmnP
MTEELVLGAYQLIVPSVKTIFQCLIMFNLPFTFIKGLFSVIITVVIYKFISPLLKGKAKA